MGVKLQRQIDAFDKFVVRLKYGSHHHVVYKHTISAITPMVNRRQRDRREEKGIAAVASD